MEFLKNLFGNKDEPIRTYEDFWSWFEKEEKVFYKVVKYGYNIEKNFFSKLSPRLDALKEGYYFLTGMYDDDTAELVFSAEGEIKNIVFVEELVSAAPQLANWRFTALKPELDLEDVNISMAGYSFSRQNLSFYAIDHQDFPDEIDIVFVYDDYDENDKSVIVNGIYIFLDNLLGELRFATAIDNLAVISRSQAEKELIPVPKLKDYLLWREKEFVEKYTGLRYETANDSFLSMEGKLEDGTAIVLAVNATLLEWDSKASHPWILRVEIPYDGSLHRGMPDDLTFRVLDEFEEELMLDLKDYAGYLNVGRQTGNNRRIIYFACKGFRKPAKILHVLAKRFGEKFTVEFDLYKDKYWQSLQWLRPGL